MKESTPNQALEATLDSTPQGKYCISASHLLSVPEGLLHNAQHIGNIITIMTLRILGEPLGG